MTPEVETFVILVAVGVLLLAAEVFIPGGIAGMVGGLLLLAAAVASFHAFGTEGGWLATTLMVVLSGAALTVWIRLFPKTPIGRRLTLERDGRDVKAVDPHAADIRVGAEGVAHTDLRPGGVALLAGRRVDVLSESGYLSAGTSLSVVRTEGARIIVRRTPQG